MESLGELSDIKTVERIGWIALAVGLIPPIVLLAYALIAWLQVGHFPIHGHPDPKEMGTRTMSAVVLMISLLSPYCLMLADISSTPLLLVAGLQRHRALRNLLIVVMSNLFFFWVMLDGQFGLGLLNWIGD